MPGWKPCREWKTFPIKPGLSFAFDHSGKMWDQAFKKNWNHLFQRSKAAGFLDLPSTYQHVGNVHGFQIIFFAVNVTLQMHQTRSIG